MQRSTLARTEGDPVVGEVEQAIIDQGGRVTGTMQELPHILRYSGTASQLRKELDALVGVGQKILKPVAPRTELVSTGVRTFSYELTAKRRKELIEAGIIELIDPSSTEASGAVRML